MDTIDMYHNQSQTLCWRCINATGGCSWSQELIPIPGWEARKTYIENKFYSYEVFACPEYQPGGCGRDPDEMMTQNCAELLETAMERARKDYPHSNQRDREVIEDFISDWLPDGVGVIDELRELARAHDEQLKSKSEEVIMIDGD